MLARMSVAFLLLVPAAAAPAAQPDARVADPAARSAGSARFQAPERAAIERCAPRVGRFGTFQVDDVRRRGRSGWRVDGTVSDGGAGLNYGYGLRRGFGHRTFTCTVEADGRVGLKTARIRRY